MTPMEKAELLHKLADQIELHVDDLAQIETLNLGMPIGDAKGNALAGVSTLRYVRIYIILIRYVWRYLLTACTRARARTLWSQGTTLDGLTRLQARPCLLLLLASSPTHGRYLLASLGTCVLTNTCILRKTLDMPRGSHRWCSVASLALGGAPRGCLETVLATC